MGIVSPAEIVPLNYFLHSYGPVSMPTMHLGWVFASIVTMVFIVVAALLAACAALQAALRTRRRRN